jgi:hypothetical protein
MSFKFFYLTISVLFFTKTLLGQGVGINETSSSPDPSAMLDVSSTTRGVLIPRTDTTTINAATTPAVGLLIYQNSDNIFYYYNGTKWVSISGSGQNTLDQAYDEGGAGLGRIITADAGPVEVQGDSGLYVGTGNSGSGQYNFISGSNNTVSGNSSVALGENNLVSGGLSTAIGNQNTVSGTQTLAIGYNNDASGNNSIAAGHSNTINSGGTYSAVFGRSNIINNASAFAGGGEGNTISGDGAAAVSSLNGTVSGEYAFIANTGNDALANNSFAAGYTNTINSGGTYSAAFGRSNIINNGSAFSGGGQGNTISAYGAAAVASLNGTVSGQYAFIANTGNDALANNSFAAGYTNTINSGGTYAAAFGRSNIINNGSAFAGGGQGNTISAYGAAAIGALNGTVSGQYALIIGNSNTVSANYAFAQGSNVEVTGQNGAAFGDRTEATNWNTAAFGYFTSATGNSSFAAGHASVSSGTYTAAFGIGNEAASGWEMAVGSYGTTYTPASTTGFDATDRAFTVGNGTGTGARSNALTVYKSGEVNINDAYSLPTTDGTIGQIMSTDGSGNLSWIAPTIDTDTDDQFADVFQLNGNNLELSLDGDGVATQTVDLSAYLDADNLGNHTATTNIQLNNNWLSNDGDSEGVYVDTDGKVGIGTSTPTGNLEVLGTTENTITLKTSVSDANPVGVAWENTGGLYAWSIHRENTNDDLVFRGGHDDASITNLDEVMRLNRNGVGIGGAVAGAHSLNVNGTAGLSTGTSWTNTSDVRLKDVHGNYSKGLAEIMKLRTVTYNYKKDNPLGLPSDKTIVGFVAQEVGEVIPEAIVRSEEHEYLQLNVDPIHWAAINAIQEQQEMIEQLKTGKTEQQEIIKNLQSQNELLEQRLEKIEAFLNNK